MLVSEWSSSSHKCTTSTVTGKPIRQCSQFVNVANFLHYKEQPPFAPPFPPPEATRQREKKKCVVSSATTPDVVVAEILLYWSNSRKEGGREHPMSQGPISADITEGFTRFERECLCETLQGKIDLLVVRWKFLRESLREARERRPFLERGQNPHLSCRDCRRRWAAYTRCLISGTTFYSIQAIEGR